MKLHTPPSISTLPTSTVSLLRGSRANGVREARGVCYSGSVHPPIRRAKVPALHRTRDRGAIGRRCAACSRSHARRHLCARLQRRRLESSRGPAARRNGSAGERRVRETRDWRSYSSRPSSTQIVVWNDERELAGASQFQPPSLSCSPTRRRARRSDGRPKNAPSASTPPLMHGSTSPSKNGEPDFTARKSHRPV